MCGGSVLINPIPWPTRPALKSKTRPILAASVSRWVTSLWRAMGLHLLDSTPCELAHRVPVVPLSLASGPDGRSAAVVGPVAPVDHTEVDPEHVAPLEHTLPRSPAVRS